MKEFLFCTGITCVRTGLIGLPSSITWQLFVDAVMVVIALPIVVVVEDGIGEETLISQGNTGKQIRLPLLTLEDDKGIGLGILPPRASFGANISRMIIQPT